ncbi:hypothetical protein IJF81_00985 [bacterium]|nr:hypothetical protein [bacterium]
MNTEKQNQLQSDLPSFTNQGPQDISIPTGNEIINYGNGTISRSLVQRILAQEFANIENLLRQGKINENQVAELTNNAIEKTRKLLQDFSVGTALDNTDFFNKNGRQEVLEYLKGLDTDFDDDEISQITKLIESLEKNAVKNYLDELKLGENLEKENSQAKMKLNTNAQNSSSSTPYQKLFTRADIGKMSTDEFLKNEKLIMDQLRKGQIK